MLTVFVSQAHFTAHEDVTNLFLIYMKTKPSKRSLKALQSIRNAYSRKGARKMLSQILAAALSSKEAENWPSALRGEAHDFYVKLRKAL